MSGVSGPDFVIAGTQKTGTTWLYRGLREHPDVLMPHKDGHNIDSINYFDGLNYHRGREWYLSHYDHYDGESVVGEETPSYIRSHAAPRRLADDDPDVQLLFCVRDPIRRAFSHYWHLKGRDKVAVSFETALHSPDFYRNWIVPGFYHQHIQRYREYFDDDQITVLFFDDLVSDDEAYLRGVYDLVGVDSAFDPSILDRRVNEARATGQYYELLMHHFTNVAPRSVIEAVRPLHDTVQNALMTTTEYDEGPSAKMQAELAEIYREDVSGLEEYTGRNLDHWLD